VATIGAHQSAPTAPPQYTTLAAMFPLNPHASGGADLVLVRLDTTPKLVILFTDSTKPIATHWIEQGTMRGEIQCNKGAEGRCLICDLGHIPTTKTLMPVYDVASASVGVLSIPEGKGAHSLGPLLMAEINRGNLAARYLALTRNYAKYSVTSLVAQMGQDMGEAIIKAFLVPFSAGHADLTMVIPVTTNACLWDVPELERLARARGLARSVYIQATAA